MSEICSICGLPKDLCVCESIAKENLRIVIKSEKRKFGKAYTVIEGIDQKQIDMKDLLKTFKNTFACGGTIKNGIVELQGNHRNRVKPLLLKLGFSEDTIDVK
ncbi:translation initiation factor [Candidatus Woesearchaeota archaeon]|nr:translation initiation factor [Candidatus Woesearchaeota archaeon]